MHDNEAIRIHLPAPATQTRAATSVASSVATNAPPGNRTPIMAIAKPACVALGTKIFWRG